MSRRRYTCRESAETISRGQCSPNATATAVFPTAVGPTSTGTRSLSPAKPALQLFLGELDDRRAAMHIVRRERRGEQLAQQLTHLPLTEGLARLHRRLAGVGR